MTDDDELMNGAEPGLEDDLAGDLDEDEAAVLSAVNRLAAMARDMVWFSAVGAPHDEATRGTAEAYLAALGFPDTYVAPVETWEDAADAADSSDMNSAWWEAEEQLRAALTTQAVERLGEDAVAKAGEYLAGETITMIGEAITVACALGGVDDVEVQQAATGAACQAAYQAVLVILAGAGEDHPFALKYRLFELGRWPLGVAGGTFNLF